MAHSSRSSSDDAVPEFLTLAEVADYLRVDYKSVYRLVRGGDLPAAKVGGVYRVRRLDLEEYLEASKHAAGVGGVAAHARGRCSSCGRLYFSALSLPGVCEVCGAPICESCVRLDRKRLCTIHEEAVRPGRSVEGSGASWATREELFPDGAVACGLCGRLIPAPEGILGTCSHPECESPLCRRCWKTGEATTCRTHLPEPDQLLAQAREAFEAGEVPVLVTAGTALGRVRYRISRFRQILEDSIPVAGGSKQPSPRVFEYLRYARGRGLSPLRVPKGEPEAELSNLEPHTVLTGPVRGAAPVGSEQAGDVLVGFHVFSRPEPYRLKGFDTERGTRQELGDILRAHLDLVRDKGSEMVLAVASVTGWSPEAKALILDPGRTADTFFDPSLAVVLLDLDREEMTAPQSDRRVQPFRHLFAGESSLELSHRIRGHCVETLKGRYSLSAREVSEAFDVPLTLVEKIFKALAVEGGYVVDRIEGHGSVLSEKS